MGDGLINPWFPEKDLILHQVLGKAAEECSELGSALARCLIQGFYEAEPVTEKLNRVHVREEMADTLAVLDWLAEVRLELACRDSDRYHRKLNGFRKWQAMLEAEGNG